MENLFNNLLEGSIILLVLYGFYKLMLSRLTFFSWNRSYLVSMLLAAAILPFLSFDWGPTSSELLGYQLPAVTIGEESVQKNEWSTWQILSMFYLAGTILFASKLLWAFARTMVLINRAKVDTFRGKRIHIHPAFSPASFFGFILLPSIPEDEEQANTIVLHESIHAAKGHSIDLIIFQIVRCMYWFFPWMSRIEADLREIHEFEADQAVLHIKAPKAYAQMLLNLLYEENEHLLLNNFNQFLTKKRILMMTQAKSKLIQKLRFLPALPLIGLLFVAIACEDNQEPGTPAAVETGTILEADEVFDVVEESPNFPGGMEAWGKFMMDNLEYPALAKRMGVEGTVYLVFEIRTDGSVQNVEILRGIGAGCDEEAMRVVKKSPNWIPGKQRGRNVNVRMRLPVRFKLGENTVSENRNLIPDRKFFPSNRQLLDLNSKRPINPLDEC
jgi:TonB family protein